MGKVAARNCKVVLDGRDVSGVSNSATLTFSAEAPEVTSFGDSNRTRMNDGLKDVEFTLDGFYDTGASGMDVAYSSMVAASVVTAFFPQGYSASNAIYEFVGIMTSYEQTFAVEDAAATSATIAGCAPLFRGKVLYGGTLSGAGASNLSSVDFTSGALGARYAVVHLLTLTGANGEFSASVQESANDSDWTTTTAVVTSVSAAQAGSPQAASVFTISSASRYQRVAASLTGTSPCATFVVVMGNIHYVSIRHS